VFARRRLSFLLASLLSFIEHYRREHGLSSRSEVISRGLEKLREAELARAYQEHAAEWQRDPDKEFWDVAALGPSAARVIFDDGLESDAS